MMKLTLKKAIDEDLLPEFIAQCEAEGVRVADEEQFASAMAAIVRRPRSKDRTSRSPSAGDSTGT